MPEGPLARVRPPRRWRAPKIAAMLAGLLGLGVLLGGCVPRRPAPSAGAEPVDRAAADAAAPPGAGAAVAG
ncbi:MAG TPA: hypothetical protein PLW24_04215, partial [Burkholderiaceae bacterium]|nr:hypothetical protein [Burkholderiaceae bacterium]